MASTAYFLAVRRLSNSPRRHAYKRADPLVAVTTAVVGFLPFQMSTMKNSSSAALLPGTKLSHYLVQERLGGGGMGTVYRARDTRLARDVAIKVINTDIAGDVERIARFHREARAVATLENHPEIVIIHDTGEEHGTPYIVTELVDGTTVRTLLAGKKALGTGRVIEIGSQVADALAAAHGAGITHRDVKPENIMVTRATAG